MMAWQISWLCIPAYFPRILWMIISFSFFSFSCRCVLNFWLQTSQAKFFLPQQDALFFNPSQSLRQLRSKIGSVGRERREDVAVAGVGEVREQVVDGALARVHGLEPEADEGEHGEPPVLDLLGAQHHHGLRGPAAPVGPVEPQPPGVPHVGHRVLAVREARLDVHAPGPQVVRPPPPLRPPHQRHLRHEQRPGVREVLAGPGVEPREPRVDEAPPRQQVRDQDARRRQHRPPPVHQLRLREPPQQLRLRT
uniref:Uncharacterized protein n=1 Tax=Zea mays TaxID=4577 RepID=C4J5I2_MAIZE|nr:unknown [Zea mays]